ncbi:hypothetical protein WN51_12310 [Melipona quadrifasciata]|uniref:Uncharacterized protein n=1 Tax=Melipona quadrifasciata TaxID=166423 RepID=A0A0M9A2D7_9HYME|nr:hypothetical protein WN51_12310 [Melipona quadrifasciata]
MHRMNICLVDQNVGHLTNRFIVCLEFKEFIYKRLGCIKFINRKEVESTHNGKKVRELYTKITKLNRMTKSIFVEVHLEFSQIESFINSCCDDETHHPGLGLRSFLLSEASDYTKGKGKHAEQRVTLLTGFESMSSFTLGRRENKCPGHGHVKEKGKQRDALANSSLAAISNFETLKKFSKKRLMVEQGFVLCCVKWMFLRRLLEDFSGFRFVIYCERGIMTATCLVAPGIAVMYVAALGSSSANSIKIDGKEINVFTIRVHSVCAESRNPEVVSQFTSNCFPDQGPRSGFYRGTAKRRVEMLNMDRSPDCLADTVVKINEELCGRFRWFSGWLSLMDREIKVGDRTIREVRWFEVSESSDCGQKSQFQLFSFYVKIQRQKSFEETQGLPRELVKPAKNGFIAGHPVECLAMKRLTIIVTQHLLAIISTALHHSYLLLWAQLSEREMEFDNDEIRPLQVQRKRFKRLNGQQTGGKPSLPIDSNPCFTSHLRGKGGRGVGVVVAEPKVEERAFARTSMTMGDYATVLTTPPVALLSRHCQMTNIYNLENPENERRRFLIGTTSFIARAADDNGDDGDEDDDEDEDEDEDRSRDSTIELCIGKYCSSTTSLITFDISIVWFAGY